MYKLNISVKQLLTKISIIAIITYITLFLMSTAATGILFIGLNYYKNNIEKFITEKTHYKVQIGTIRTKFHDNYLPELLLNDLIIQSENSKENLHLKRVEFILSYASIWHFTLIFNKIIVNSVNLDLVRLPNNEFTLNGIELKSDNDSTKFDLEGWLLKQHQINLNNINFSFLDQKNNIAKFIIPTINLSYTNNLLNKHKLIFQIINPIKKPTNLSHIYHYNILDQHDNNTRDSIFIKLIWGGEKFANYRNWQYANLEFFTHDSNIFAWHVKNYLPQLVINKDYLANSTLIANIQHGNLENLHSNFDISNFAYYFNQTKRLLKFPKIKGQLDINLINNNYIINAKNLSVNTNQGNLITNQKIAGYYQINKNGYIDINNISIANLRPIFNNNLYLKDINLSGMLNLIKIAFDGNIFSPKNINLNIFFHDVGINSNNINIPSLNHISGDVNFNDEQGKLNLLLNNSVLNYNKIFYLPIKFINVVSELTWAIKQPSNNKSKDSILTVRLLPTIIKTTDFNINTQGYYIYSGHDLGYLKLTASLDKMRANLVGFYLPKVIGDVNLWLQTAIKDGDATNATLDLHGNLNNFPFATHNKSTQDAFIIDANINNGKLKYANNWQSLDNIIGKFMIRNEKIIIMATKVNVNNNNIDKVVVTIPDMTESHSYLIAKANGYGLTNNFFGYLRNTPINQTLNYLPQKLSMLGNGQVNLKLYVPFYDFNKTTFDGSYNFINNSLKTDLPIPYLEHIDGYLNFSDKGIVISGIKANALNSKISITADTIASKVLRNNKKHDAVIKIKINSNKLDLQNLTKYYLPQLTPLIAGFANGDIQINLTNNSLQNIVFNSNMYDAVLKAPSPLQKNNHISRLFNLQITNTHNQEHNINFNYNNLLLGDINLNNNYQIINAKIGLHEVQASNLKLESMTNIATIDNYDLFDYNAKLTDIIYYVKLYDNQVYNQELQLPTNNEQPAKINIKLTPNSFNLTNWLSLINNFYYSNVSHNKKSLTANTVDLNNTSYPSMYLALNTPNFYLNDNINLQKTLADMYLSDNVLRFNFINYYCLGNGLYKFSNNHFNLHFDYLNFNDNLNKQAANTTHKYSTHLNTEHLDIESINLDELFKIRVKQIDRLDDRAIHAIIPYTTIDINNLVYNDKQLGTLKLKILGHDDDIIIESSVLKNKFASINFHGINYCVYCQKTQPLMSANINIYSKNFGNFLDDLGFKDILQQGSGNINIKTEYIGLTHEIDMKHLDAIIDVEINGGKFLKTNTDNFIGKIIGIINLQTIVNLIKFNFNSIFSNGFAFDTLDIKAYLTSHQLYVKYLYMSGTLAVVGLKGSIDLTNNQLNMVLSITPHLGIGVAVGAAIITVNPLVGVATYIAELLLKSPVNKLFAFSFQITGKIDNPIVTQIDLSKQIKNNLNSTIGK